MNENGKVLNAEYAEKRATGYIRNHIDPTYQVTPEFEDWEVSLY